MLERALGTEAGLVTRALLTDMESPLGRTVGNAVEVDESLEVLAGGGPADVVDLTLALAVERLDAAGLDGIDPAETLKDGSAMDRFRELVAAQGGDLGPLPDEQRGAVEVAQESGMVERALQRRTLEDAAAHQQGKGGARRRIG